MTRVPATKEVLPVPRMVRVRLADGTMEQAEVLAFAHGDDRVTFWAKDDREITYFNAHIVWILAYPVPDPVDAPPPAPCCTVSHTSGGKRHSLSCRGTS